MTPVEMEASLDAPVAAGRLFTVVEDLGGYPAWLDIVRRAEPAEAAVSDEGPAWDVELRGRIGPLARSKRLRMVRTSTEPDRAVRFERRERDGRVHSPWVLEATIAEHPDGARLTMALRYGGGFGGSLLERLLQEEVDRARPRLLAQLGEGPPAR
jgi:hypothetical protein